MMLSPDVNASTGPDERGVSMGAPAENDLQSHVAAEPSARERRSASVASSGNGGRSADSPGATDDRIPRRLAGSVHDADDNNGGDAVFHARTYSNTSSLTHEHTPPYSPPFRSNTGLAHFSMRRGSAPDDGTPPMIRQTRTDLHASPRRGKHGGGTGSGSSTHSFGSNKEAAHGSSVAHGLDDSSKNGYALWLPWEETALVDWLYKPENCKLFNIPRRKKECHERIIQEILPSKTSRAIEGKIRTLEKRYQKAASEIQRHDFVIKHPGKRPEEVAEALCNYFHKLETVFNPAQAQARSQLQHDPLGRKKAQWAGMALHTADSMASSASSASAAVVPAAVVPTDHGLHSATASTSTLASAVAGTSGTAGMPMSVPRSSPPPRISMAESLPLPYRQAAQGRKIAPKRGNEGAAVDGSDDAPIMMSSNKRSRTLPAILQNRRSPGRQLTPQHQQQPHRSPLQLQQIPGHQAQQQRLYENGSRYAFDGAGRPATATLPMMQMQMPSPAAAASGQMPASLVSVVHQQQHHHQARQRHASIQATGTHEPQDTVQGGAVQGTREELDWLQFNLRREELEYRKAMFVHDQELESKRVRLEEHRLENQRREMELESKRLEVQHRQLDMQMESLKSLTSMLGQMVSRLGSALQAPAPEHPGAADTPTRPH